MVLATVPDMNLGENRQTCWGQAQGVGETVAGRIYSPSFAVKPN